jgi:thymidylate synthase (FAD)
VTPRVFHIGQTQINTDGLYAYLEASDNCDFITAIDEARQEGLSDSEILCSFYAKLCYRSLTLGHNANLKKTRDVWDNLVGTFDSAHGAVFEHVGFNFIVDQCSRVYTHEHVRHRIGHAMSQTSGRYCRYDFLQLVWDPVLDPAKQLWEEHLKATEDLIYLTECKLGMRVPPAIIAIPEYDVRGSADFCLRMRDGKIPPPPCDENPVSAWERYRWAPNDVMPFHVKKKLTSAVRRIIPQGITNEMGFSVNMRALRHMVMMRTARVAEWEIRRIFEQVYRLIKDKFPLVFYGAKEEMVDGALEITGMRMQPYELTANQVLGGMSTEEIQAYITEREKLAV